MPQPPRPLLIAAASLMLALIADLLLRGASWGVNFGIVALAVAGAYVWLQRRTQVRLTPMGQKLGILGLVFALMFSFRDSDALKAANAVAFFFCVGGMLRAAMGESLRDARFSKLLIGAFEQWFKLPLHALKLGNRTRYEGTLSPQSKSKGIAVARGLGLALPLLLVFGALFASADPVFRNNLASIVQLNLDAEALSSHFITLLVGLVLFGGILHALILRDDRPEPPFVAAPAKGRLGITEVGIVLGSLNLLFASFIAVQFRYLFGAGRTVAVTPGLSYAEYARGGFFELVWVAALALGLLLGTDALLKRDQPRSESFFRWLSRGLVLMVFCVVASALLRMKLYTDAFGLTELRIYSTIFMIWLTIAFAWMLATTLNGRPHRFAFGALLAGLGVIFVTNLCNPDRMIVLTNLSKPNADFSYLMSLSDDAMLAVGEREGMLQPKHREQYTERVQSRRAVAQADWRELNLSRWALIH